MAYRHNAMQKYLGHTPFLWPCSLGLGVEGKWCTVLWELHTAQRFPSLEGIPRWPDQLAPFPLDQISGINGLYCGRELGSQTERLSLWYCGKAHRNGSRPDSSFSTGVWKIISIRAMASNQPATSVTASLILRLNSMWFKAFHLKWWKKVLAPMNHTQRSCGSDETLKNTCLGRKGSRPSQSSKEDSFRFESEIQNRKGSNIFLLWGTLHELLFHLGKLFYQLIQSNLLRILSEPMWLCHAKTIICYPKIKEARKREHFPRHGKNLRAWTR